MSFVTASFVGIYFPSAAEWRGWRWTFWSEYDSTSLFLLLFHYFCLCTWGGFSLNSSFSGTWPQTPDCKSSYMSKNPNPTFDKTSILKYLASRWPFGTFICSLCICVSKICPTVMCDSCRAFAANRSAARQPHYTVCGLSSVGPQPPATSHTTTATTQHLPPCRQPSAQDGLSVAAARVLTVI